MKVLRGIGVLVLISLIAACASKSSSPKVLHGKFFAEADINPGKDSKARPVVVFIYYLRSEGAFNKADFFSLYRNPVETLGDSLASFSKYQLSPKQGLSFQDELSPDVRMVGVVASYRDIDHSTWRALSPLPDKAWYSVGDRISDDMSIRVMKNEVVVWFGKNAPKSEEEKPADSKYKSAPHKKFKKLK
ncbi:MAG: type VI secretion system lipoprotein TssJ [Pseudomonadales bacterium]|nr:type VI secretion system lipoprotein TssJ [Pseudomonadales bacterium]